MTAIVTDVNYRMSLALIRALGEAGVHVLACQKAGSSVPLGFRSRHCAASYLLPAEGYLAALYDLCATVFAREGERPALLPVGAATLRLLAEPETRTHFSSVAGLCIPTAEQLDLLNDKERVAQLAATCGVPTPSLFVPAEGESIDEFLARVPLPCVVKPHCGESLGLIAADRYAIVSDRVALSRSFHAFRERGGRPPLIQEYLPGGALGCSVLAEEGTVMRRICHRRVREYPITGGPSTCCDAIRDPILESYADKLSAACALTGLAMFEFKEDVAGNPRLLEVNPRVWGTYPLSRVTGSDLSLAWCTLAWNNGNPKTALSLPQAPSYPLRRMCFFPTDLLAARTYRKAGRTDRARGAIRDFFTARDGLFEWRDPRPALCYWRSLLKRRGGL